MGHYLSEMNDPEHEAMTLRDQDQRAELMGVIKSEIAAGRTAEVLADIIDELEFTHFASRRICLSAKKRQEQS